MYSINLLGVLEVGLTLVLLVFVAEWVTAYFADHLKVLRTAWSAWRLPWWQR